MRTRLIAVVGSGSEPPPNVAELGESLGAALVANGYGIVTGGRGGVQEAVCRGAVRKRGKSALPPLIGLLPGHDASAGNAYLDFAIPTGVAQAHHALVASAGEVLVCIGGATGAMAEMALARKMGRPVIALRPSGGTAALLAKVMESVYGADSVDDVIARIGALLPE
ncbi:MAG: SLOG cluster 4 domain-containing protein [Planctomycetota bacterium]